MLTCYTYWYIFNINHSRWISCILKMYYFFFFSFVSSHLPSSHAAIHLSDCGAWPGSGRPVGLWPLYFCHLCGGSHDEDSPEATEKPTVQAAGQPPALSAQHDPEVCWSMTSDSVCWCHRGLVMSAERHWAGQEVTVSCFQSTANADGGQCTEWPLRFSCWPGLHQSFKIQKLDIFLQKVMMMPFRLLLVLNFGNIFIDSKSTTRD